MRIVHRARALVAAAAWCACVALRTDAAVAQTAGATGAHVGEIPGLSDAYRRFGAMRDRVEKALGHDGAAAFDRRLYDDLERQWQDAPPGYGDADWRDTVTAIAALDVQALDLIVDHREARSAPSPGLHENVLPSRVDGVLQLFATYVPPNATARSPLAIVLHGNPQTEAELLGQPFLRRLADRTGTILVAPYGRGNYDFAEPAATDVYDLTSAMQSALPVDRGRTYLAGYSMGGFSVFMIGPRGGYRWAGALCISGAILNSGVRAVTTAWKDMRTYVVTGARDESIPPRYGEQTASALAALDIPVTFYEQPDGTHALRTLMPSLQRAWDDMHAGVTHRESVPIARGVPLPAAASGAIAKP